MPPILSVLDPAPVFEGRTAQDALADTRDLAVACDELGYSSYWVQEHHNTPCFASVAPEILMADLAARTQSITLGAGGVMLPNYSPLKVAEQFSTLSALYPGRIELGLGRATGADPRTSAALLGPGAQAFPQMLALLMDWLLEARGDITLPEDHRAHGIHARPVGMAFPLWILVSSPETAAFAGAMGLRMAFADFLAPGGAPAAISAYRSAFTPSRFTREPHAGVAYVALVAEDEMTAKRESAPAAAWNVLRATGRFAPFPGAELAEAILARVDESAVHAARNRAIVGAANHVAAEITQRATHAQADEVFILTIAEHLDTRVASYRLLIKAMQALGEEQPQHRQAI
ncbi:MAG: MsnO8 family LLM class oxidoreductase [Pseudomonadota bacterium]